ncbi:MAG: PBECR4 domain-containing protein [Levilactobacillus sp.]|uniref:PBECR4 domain-containing protein n=1 Tax=Levilactobacillus sp. TaxID=2767919 RepID=UPI00258AA41A|nr:PBECR4 domain-containing protein [Levilactobacillus sp.]MCI1553448.1 PBECR4 domain-containing protein [Levilactobacillus sp.]MCI1597837.1 PBECR4 domain-containing protein [Levilactobacillus sp.]MCI1605635.1 PBECR4 domain-containing protein [Levilactobacillus sp.]
MNNQQDWIVFNARKHRFLLDNLEDMQNTLFFVRDHMLHKKFCYFYQVKPKGYHKNLKTSMSHMFIVIHKNNLQHLFGIQYKQGANTFWNHLENMSLSLPDIRLEKDWAKAKILAMKYFSKTLTTDCRSYEESTWNKLVYDHLAESTHNPVAIAYQRGCTKYETPRSCKHTKYHFQKPNSNPGIVKAIAEYNINDRISNDNPKILCQVSGFKYAANELKALFD